MPRDTQNNHESVDDLIDEGIASLEKGDYEDAVACFREVLRIMPMRNDVRQLLAHALDEEMRTERKTTLKPSKRKREKGDRSASTKVEEPAEERAARKKTSLSCFFLVAFFIVVVLAMGVIFIMFNEPILERLKTIVPEQIQPISAGEKESLALYETAQHYYRQQRYDEAIATLTRALGLHPASDPEIKAQLALVYNAKGDKEYDEGNYLSAAEAYEKAVSFNPDKVDYLYNAGWAYYQYGLKERQKSTSKYYVLARDSFEKAIKQDEMFLRAYQGLARVYIRQNRPEMAAKMYKKIIELAPESYEAENAREQLKNMFGERVR